MDEQNNMKVPILLQFVHGEQILFHCLTLWFVPTFCKELRLYRQLSLLLLLLLILMAIFCDRLWINNMLLNLDALLEIL